MAPVEIRLLNAADAPQTVDLPDRVEARLETGGDVQPLWLERAPETPPAVSVAPGGFASARYLLPASDIAEDALLSVPAWGTRQIVLAPVSTPDAPELANAAPPLPTPDPGDKTIGNAFLDNLSAYEPIYAVYGPGTNTEARIQLSLKYKLFGKRAQEDRPPSLKDGLYFAYTQRMFWDLGAHSSPFRNIDFQPEVFYLSPPVGLSREATVSGQVGLRHISNGRAGDLSRSLNTIYVAPMAAFSLGDGWRLTAAPRLWFYVGDLSDNPDIRRYRGNSGLFLQIGEEDGLRLSTTTRFSFSSGKGSFAADMSYPLRRILGGGPDFYLFGQSFVGYGENLLDYDVRTTRFRLGVALVR
ncbi:phospholipase A [Novosphingobium mangrovi (ex Huang et al. 2023)]|nr:phospholipase A [Novosphingobium mangrovi (ex Huang et al. 2023)]